MPVRHSQHLGRNHEPEPPPPNLQRNLVCLVSIGGIRRTA